MSDKNSQGRVAWPVAYGMAPIKASRAMPQSLDFTAANPIEVSLAYEEESLRLEFVQAIYVDNSANINTLTCTMLTTGQVIKVPGGWQGYVPVLASLDSTRLSFTTTFLDGAAPIVPIFYLSFPVPLALWPASLSANSVVITGSPTTDASTTITAGGTAQNLFGATVPINGWAVYNPDAANDLWVREGGTAAANGAGSIRVANNGGFYETPAGRKPFAAPTIVGAVNGQKFTAQRW